MNRGSERGPGNPPAASHCFNEAPIHESGKYPGRSGRTLVLARFNEAPIHESGKW